MVNRTAILVACGMAVTLLGGDASVVAGTNPNRLTYLTFSRSVALPGVTLDAGTYAFDVTNAESNADVVRVRNGQRNKVYYVGLTRSVERPAGLRADRSVQFGEVRSGAPVPIVAWYPHGEARGHMFLYPR